MWITFLQVKYFFICCGKLNKLICKQQKALKGSPLFHNVAKKVVFLNQSYQHLFNFSTLVDKVKIVIYNIMA